MSKVNKSILAKSEVLKDKGFKTKVVNNQIHATRGGLELTLTRLKNGFWSPVIIGRGQCDRDISKALDNIGNLFSNK